ncbi:hypothetical protein L1887_26693 [Cichorium endivia]|nr:hypothetical protein L1887_26693 [Cichorium endivia]
MCLFFRCLDRLADSRLEILRVSRDSLEPEPELELELKSGRMREIISWISVVVSWYSTGSNSHDIMVVFKTFEVEGRKGRMEVV